MRIIEIGVVNRQSYNYNSYEVSLKALLDDDDYLTQSIENLQEKARLLVEKEINQKKDLDKLSESDYIPEDEINFREEEDTILNVL